MLSVKNFFPVLVGVSVLAIYAGCLSRKPAVPGLLKGTAPVSKPVFDKTFGEVQVGDGSTLAIEYKDIRLLIDPLSMRDDASSIDYLLLTDSKPAHFGSSAGQGVRKNLKIICVKSVADALTKQGFTQVKAIGSGTRVLLQKNGGNLFVSAFQSKAGQSNETINSYLLEFDNGRNLFISGDLPSADLLRPIVYQLRDDGKEIYFGFFHTSFSEEEKCASMMALLQPKFGFVIPAGSSASVKLKENIFEAKLKDELFDGFALMPGTSAKYPF